jgi:hypothetical protein
MARWSSLRVPFKDALVLAVRNWQLWILQVVGNAVIFLAFIWWLRPHEASWWQLLYSSSAIVLTAAAALVLQGGTLNYFEDAHRDATARLLLALKSALRHLPALLLWALVFFAIEGLIGKLDQYDGRVAGFLRSEFPAWLRRIISEPALDNTYSGLMWALRWIVLPGLLLPFAMSCAGKGFRGFVAFDGWWRVVRSFAYWVTLIVAAVLGVLCVTRIMGWLLDPKTATLAGEETSLVFRLFFAYLLGIFSWLLAGSMLGRKMVLVNGQAGTQPL